MYIRFETPEGEGLFVVAYRLSEADDLSGHEQRLVRRWIGWMEDHLPAVPSSVYGCAREGSIRSWFKAGAREHVEAAWVLCGELERHVKMEMRREEEPGEVVFEDRYQVAVVREVAAGEREGGGVWDGRDRASIRRRGVDGLGSSELWPA